MQIFLLNFQFIMHATEKKKGNHTQKDLHISACFQVAHKQILKSKNNLMYSRAHHPTHLLASGRVFAFHLNDITLMKFEKEP